MLFANEKFEDCERLLDPSIDMLKNLRRDDDAKTTAHEATSLNNPTKAKSQATIAECSHVNLQLEYALCTCFILRAILCLRVSQNSKMTLEDQDAYISESFNWADQFE